MGFDSRAKSAHERPTYLSVYNQQIKWLTINDHSS